MNLNFSNRLVRTRMPGGVGGAGARRRPYPDKIGLFAMCWTRTNHLGVGLILMIDEHEAARHFPGTKHRAGILPRPSSMQHQSDHSA